MVLENEDGKLTCLIADSAAFLRNVDLENLSHNVYTVKEVVKEIRDSATKQRLAVLPYEINFRIPSAESIHFVTEFSKKTGDYKSLSAVDIQVLALTHQLEKEFGNPRQIKDAPTRKSAVVQKSHFGLDKEMSGFYFERKKLHPESHTDLDGVDQIPICQEHSLSENREKSSDLVDDMVIEEKEEPQADGISKENIDVFSKDILEMKEDIGNCRTEGFDEHKSDENDENDVNDVNDDNDDDNEGWITPSNLDKVKQTFGMVGDTKIKESDVKCACLTTDFAMQNVLIQMGLNVLSVEGLLIKQARSYIQKCFGCFKETHEMTKVFCPSCGNKTLKKVAVSIAEDGTLQYHYPKRMRNPKLKGTIFPIPAPKGGRHGNPYILVEDQPTGKKRLPKSKDKADPLDPDYCARSNPFSFNDVNSRAFNLGLHVRQRQPQNPNQSKKKRSGRKK